MRARRTAMGVAVAAVTALLGASYAFACTATAYLEPLSPNAGPRGSEVTVTGRSWAAASNATVGPVEIRWGNENGPMLGSANGPEFSVKVIIPDAPPGYYLVVGVARDRDGAIVGRQSRTFRLTATSPDGTSTQSGGSTAPTGGSTSSAPSGSTAPTADPPEQAASPAEPSPAPATPASATPASATPAPAATATTERSPTSPGPSGAGASPRPESAPVAPATSPPPTSAVARPTPAAAGAVLEDAAPVPASVVVPTAAGATGDQVAPLSDPSTLWGGVRSEVPPRARPSLISDVPPGATRTSPALGIALLGVGMASLSVSAMVVAVSRRRAPAHRVHR